MGDDDNVVVTKTFEELFQIYSNYKIDPLDIDNEVFEAILLSQIDIWLKKSKLMKTTFSPTETGLAWMKFKKWRLDFDEFSELLKDLCIAKNLDVDQIKDQMTEAGQPGAETEPQLRVR